RRSSGGRTWHRICGARGLRRAALDVPEHILYIPHVADLRELNEPHLEVKPRLRRRPQFAFQLEEHVEESDQILFREGRGAIVQSALLLRTAENLFLERQLYHQQVANTADE